MEIDDIISLLRFHQALTKRIYMLRQAGNFREQWDLLERLRPLERFINNTVPEDFISSQIGPYYVYTNRK